MADKVGETYVNLGLRKADFEAGLRRAEGSLKEFQRQSLAIGKTIRAGFVSLFGGIAIGEVWDLSKVRAGYDEQMGILDNLSAKYGTTAAAITGSMREASEGMVANADLMNVALGGLTKGLSPDQLIDLADAAKLLGDVAGTDTTKALEDLSQALETGRTRTLKNYLGTTIDLTEAFGGLEVKMTDAEKSQALYNLVMQSYIELQQRQNKAVDDGADKIDRMTASFNNAKLAMGKVAKGMVAGAYDFMTSAWQGFSTLNPAAYEKQLGDEIRAKQEKGKKAAADYKAANDKLKKRVSTRVGPPGTKSGGGAKTGGGRTIAAQNDGLSMTDALNWAAQARNLSYLEKYNTDSVITSTTESAIEAFDTIEDESETMAEAMKNAITGWGAHFAGTLNDAVWGADASFRSIAESFGKMITEMLIQRTIVEPMMESFMSIGGDFLSNMFSGLSTPSLGVTTLSSGAVIGANYGGGATTAFKFAEGGVIAEPVFGIGKSGRSYMFGEGGEPEVVIPSSKLSSGRSSGGSEAGAVQNFSISIVAADARSFSDMVMRNPEAIIAPFRKALRSGDRGLISDMRGVV